MTSTGVASAASQGGLKLGKVPMSSSFLFKIDFPLALFKGFLLADVLPYGFFIKSHLAHTVSRAPEMLRHHLLVTQNLWVNSHRTLVLDKPYRKGDTMLRGMLAHMWTGIRCPSASSIPRCRHTSLITSPTCFFTFPYGILFQYFGMMTIWYLHFHRTWDILRY
jgi:hypothetical protein